MADPLDLGLLLLGCTRAIEAQLVEGLDTAGFGTVTPAQARLLRRVSPDGSRLTAL